jgi:Anti-sigma-K factor rskA
VHRPPVDFSTRRIIALLEDPAHRPVWAIRLAPAAHLIAADSIAPQPVPPDRVYQLWLSAEGVAGLRQLGLLPQQGHKSIPVSPENAQLLMGSGRLEVTLEPVGGSPQALPSGRVAFDGKLEGGPEPVGLDTNPGEDSRARLNPDGEERAPGKSGQARQRLRLGRLQP